MLTFGFFFIFYFCVYMEQGDNLILKLENRLTVESYNLSQVDEILNTHTFMTSTRIDFN